MKKCKDCNVQMIENCDISSQLTFELGADGSGRLYAGITDGKIERKTIFGKIITEDNYHEHEIKGRVCPQCGKVELYVNLTEED